MGDGTGCDNMTCIILRFDDLKGLATQAVTRTIMQPADDLSFLEDSPAAAAEDEEPQMDESMEVANAVKSVQEEEEEFNEQEAVPIPITVVAANGNGEQHPSSSLSPPSSPVTKKPRLDSSPQNGSSGIEVDQVTASAE